MVNGTYDASAGVFLLFKFIYTSSLALPFKDLLVFYAIGTASIWFKTFLFAPFKNLKNPESENYSVFENSVVKSCTVQEKEIIHQQDMFFNFFTWLYNTTCIM